MPKDTEVVFKDKKEVDNLDFPGKIAVVRQAYLKASDFAKYGFFCRPHVQP